jgi:hypothetical protein
MTNTQTMPLVTVDFDAALSTLSEQYAGISILLDMMPLAVRQSPQADSLWTALADIERELTERGFDLDEVLCG